MGYDLRPINKKVSEIRFGAFIWPSMLRDTGMGYVLGCGNSIEPFTYIYNKGNKGSPCSNDGYRVYASEAIAMAKVARGYVSVHRYVNKLYEEMAPEKREKYEGNPNYVQPHNEVFLKQLEEFADFAEKSGGFTIN